MEEVLDKHVKEKRMAGGNLELCRIEFRREMKALKKRIDKSKKRVLKELCDRLDCDVWGK